MQKIDFVKNLKIITEKLKSVEIIDQFNKGLKNPGEAYEYSTINSLLFLSKSGYDQIKNDIRYSEILTILQGENVYEEQNLSRLTTVLKRTSASGILVYKSAVDLFNFHRTLLQTLQLSEKLLESELISKSLSTEAENGVIVFQVLVDGIGLKTEKYIKIFTAINELTGTISKIVGEQNEISEIILLDSGSDSNVGVKSGVETTKSMFLIFKEIWDIIVNFRYYKQDKKNKALLDSLSIRSEIAKKVEEGVLTEEEAKKYSHIIKTRTDELIGLKVLPKQLVNNINQVDNKKLLSELEATKLLSSDVIEPNQL